MSAADKTASRLLGAAARGHDTAKGSVVRSLAALLERLDGRIGFESAARLVVFEGACQLAAEVGCGEAAIQLRAIADHFDGGAS